MKYEIKQITQTVKDGNNPKIDKLKMEVKEIKYEVRKMAENLRNSEMLLFQLTKKDNKNVYSLKEKEKGNFKSGMCDLKCEN